MVRDAEAYADNDRKRKELIEARNEADSLAYSTEKSVQEHKVRGPPQGRCARGGGDLARRAPAGTAGVPGGAAWSDAPYPPPPCPNAQARLPQAVVDDITAALAAVREAAAGEDLALLRDRIGALSNASMKIGESLAQQSGSGGGGSSSGGSGSGDSGSAAGGST
jgi:hypothetical protein